MYATLERPMYCVYAPCKRDAPLADKKKAAAEMKQAIDQWILEEKGNG